MHVQIIADFGVLREALTDLVTGLGFTAHTADALDFEGVLAYLSRSAPPYPAPAPVPTLALFSGGDDEVARLLQRGYRGCLLTRTLGTLAAPQLTEREQEVLDLLSAGLTNRAIAERLGISERTVKAHVSNLFDNHGVMNRTELVMQALA